MCPSILCVLESRYEKGKKTLVPLSLFSVSPSLAIIGQVFMLQKVTVPMCHYLLSVIYDIYIVIY